ncbi:restriction endonuclease subunit S [Clostridium perfringens]|uniref:restriction endonuclease subunit S n=1 Tax=Clostridium perfringens TaxID=1502 RepID=UPI000E14ABFD|nr:restriction endonuclease subunit S [Clostridium perfringens]MBI6012533.1 restriction endonuclease subunit S [Clostridium perfringens]UBK84274.1 restriction endonuclease subunit S [Clostridium perfringens]SUY32996.1 restriction endonuclease S subunit [Clostridium perfringens]SUY39311.1 restriction endonuclease S subunit [Clostridium perfringens]HBI7032834.1 restriction endonuclease subunit S [Clostridium perfringens]
MKVELLKIKDFASVVSGATPKTNIEEYWNGNFNWITPAEIKENDKYINNTFRKVSEEGIKSSSLKLLEKGTVLLTSRAPIGKVAIVGKEMYCNQGFKNIVCNKSIVNPEYIFYWLKNNTDYLNSLGRGATFKEISKSIVENIEVPIYSLDVQNKIVEVLNKSQEIIDKRKKQIEELDLLVKSKFVGRCTINA